MFESHFTRWEWLKISWLIFYIYVLKYTITPKERRILGCLFALPPALCVVCFYFERRNFHIAIIFVLIFLIYHFILLPNLYMLNSRRKKALFFYNYPTKEEQETFLNGHPNIGRFNFHHHTILDEGRKYDLLIETSQIFLLVSQQHFMQDAHTTSKLVIHYIPIKKAENKELLKSNNFITLLRPLCKHLIQRKL